MIKKVRVVIAILAICTGILIVALMPDTSLAPKDAPIINGERYIVVVIASYNNSKWYEKNLSTLFAQKYSNYHVIYIDDSSSDNTFKLVKNYVYKMGQSHRVTLINNKERKGALDNLYSAIHSCSDCAIIITYDGDDWMPLGVTDVLQTINEAYVDPNVLLTYGQFETFPGKHLGICHPMPDYIIDAKSYRKEHWFTSHMRTFYAGLFKKIRKEDLMMDGEFYSVSWDQAFMLPMLEMASGHIKFIDKIMYVYNQANPLNDFRQHLRKQLNYERLIRRKECYTALDLKEAQSSFCIV